MKPEEYTEQLKAACPDALKSVVLYGSAVTGDHMGERSDYNVLVVLDRIGTSELKALAAPTEKWLQAGNPPPLLFTPDRLQKSADVFPLEILDMKDARRVLSGEDILADLNVSKEHLRFVLERELKGKLIQLRREYVCIGGKPEETINLMIETLATFLVLFRGTLRLYREDVPEKKIDAMETLDDEIAFDAQPFRTLNDLKAGTKKAKDVVSDDLFESYLKSIETVVDAVDVHKGN